MWHFLLTTLNRSGVVANAGGDLSFDRMRQGSTRYEPGNSPRKQMVDVMRQMIGDHVLNHVALKSIAISDSGLTKQTLCEVICAEGKLAAATSTRTYSVAT